MIFIGTSGYAYSEWGSFYPKGINPKQRLMYYALQFNAVELNFSAYSPPTASQLTNMGLMVPDGFLFSVKGPIEITHRYTADREFFGSFAQALRPLVEMKKMACVLLQFPYRFHNTLESTEYLRRIRDQLPDTPLVIEFRTADWLAGSDRERTLSLLRDLSMGFCCVDMPRLAALPPPIVECTSSIGYVRFHGRNQSTWWEHEGSSQRYDYHYTVEELSEWILMIHWLDTQAATVLVFTNNHARAESVDAARQLKLML